MVPFKHKIHSMFVIFALCILSIVCFPDQGKWSFTVKQKECQYFQVFKALFSGSVISLRVICDPSDVVTKEMKVKIGYVVRETPCFEEYLGPQLSMPEFLSYYYWCPVSMLGDFGYNQIRYIRKEIEVTCNHIIDQKLIPMKNDFVIGKIGGNTTNCTPRKKTCDINNEHSQYDSHQTSNFKNEIVSNKLKREINKQVSKIKSHKPQESGRIEINQDGIYLLIVHIWAINPLDKFNATVDIEMKSSYGYLSAADWPLLPFYGIMCVVYVFYATAWLTVSALQWRDLLRIQFWVGAVIFLGMIEKAVFYAEYHSINETGQSVKGAVLFAELLSSAKRCLARMLVIIVSLGFGIVKPRLGPMLHRVVVVGGLYFTLSAIESCLRVYKPKSDPTNQTLMAGIPLAVLDSIICWWVFSSLIQTTRTLRLRRNAVKLNLYRQFTNTLIFAVLSSIAFMVWVIHYHKLTLCLTVWKEIWCDEAYWHLLFSVILLVIMILWRPTNNNQRYAYTPLLDASDDEDTDNLPNTEAFDGIKMRQHRNSGSSMSNTDLKSKDGIISKETEEDLKWIEENIPTSLVDAALPALVDSDEEIMTTKFERNKME